MYNSYDLIISVRYTIGGKGRYVRGQEEVEQNIISSLLTSSLTVVSDNAQDETKRKLDTDCGPHQSYRCNDEILTYYYTLHSILTSNIRDRQAGQNVMNTIQLTTTDIQAKQHNTSSRLVPIHTENKLPLLLMLDNIL